MAPNINYQVVKTFNQPKLIIWAKIFNELD
jgi:hypothetical protein